MTANVVRHIPLAGLFVAPSSDVPERPESAAKRSRRWLRQVILTALIVLGLYAFRFAPDWSNVLSHIVTLEVFAGACLSVGALAGFLFGIPRSPASVASAPVTSIEDDNVDAQVPPSARSAAALSRPYADNTNLEQVSDWLTKMLIGIGLTQITGVPNGLATLSRSVAPALGGGPDAEVGVASSIVLFAFLGFIYGYLWSRLAMVRALAEERFASLNSNLERWFRRQEDGERARDLVERQLDANETEVALEDLKKALRAAPESCPKALRKASEVRRREHESARRLRHDGDYRGWERHLGHMERSVPVLEALLEADWDDSVRRLKHQAHAQLGYALKDKSTRTDRDTDAALEHFTLALSIEEHDGLKVSPRILFNRAICRIRSRQAARPILDDLTTALQEDDSLADYDGEVRDWYRGCRDDEYVREWTKSHQGLAKRIETGDDRGHGGARQ